MKDLQSLMRVYHQHHTKNITKFTHFIGVPSIIFALEILLSWPRVSIIPLSWLAVATLFAYYLYLNVRLGIVTGLLLVVSNYLAVLIVGYDSYFATIVMIATFIFGWIAQFIGHYFEGKRPAFMSNLFQVFVAPIFLVAEGIFMLGYLKEFQSYLYDNK